MGTVQYSTVQALRQILAVGRTTDEQDGTDGRSGEVLRFRLSMMGV